MERKRRLVYGFWALLLGALLVTALRSLVPERWPRPLAHDQLLVVASHSQEILLFDSHQEGAINSQPWAGLLLRTPTKESLWQFTVWETSELRQIRPADWTIARRIPVEVPFNEAVLTSDGRQIQAQIVSNSDPELLWIETASGTRRERPTTCKTATARLLQPLRRDEAIQLCLWELWTIRPDGVHPLLTTQSGGPTDGCTRYAGRPFAVATDLNRQRLWLTGEGGLLCQLDPRSGSVRAVATLPILESERVAVTSIQHAPETDLLYIGIHPWGSDPQTQRILIWDLRQSKLRGELTRQPDPIRAFYPSSDGAHLYALLAIRPGESFTRLVVINAATGKVERELGQIPGAVQDWAILPK